MSEMMYVAKHPVCHSLVVMICDAPRYRRETAKSVADCIRRGFDVQRVTHDEFLLMPRCKCPFVNGKKQHVAPSEVTA